MVNDEFWEPPQAVTLKTLLNDFDRVVDNRVIHTGKNIRYRSNGKYINKTIGQADACIFIERLVKSIIKSGSTPYGFRDELDGATVFYERMLAERMHVAVSLLGLFDSYHQYSEHVAAFLYSCWTISSMCGVDLAAMARKSRFDLELFEVEVINDIALMIQSCATEEWFRRAENDRKWEAREREQVIGRKTEEILHYYRNTMNLRLNFGYRGECRKLVTVDMAFEHLYKFISMKSWDRRFEHVVGYTWRIEHGETKGFHMHVALLLNGSKVRADGLLGLAFQHLWDNEITQGLGETDVCNTNKHRYEADRIGVGTFDRTDAHGCLNVIAANKYLGKESQYLRVKPAGRKTFGCSLPPDIENKPGRPTQSPAVWCNLQ